MATLAILMPTSERLRDLSRFRRLTAERLRLADVLVLLGAGFAAASATALLDFGLRIPGHAILRTVLPLAAGLALVPRRGSGVATSAAAALSLVLLRGVGGSGGGAGAMTSLLLTGPLLDLAAAWARRGWQIYLSFAAAGLASNMAAFSVRYFTKSAGAGRALAEWQPQAIVTYATCGLLAGLLGAAICFRATGGSRNSAEAAP